MNTKRFAFATVAAFVFVFVFEMLWHGFLMKGMYEATMSVWRPQAECDMKVMLASQILFAAIFTLFYTKVGKALPCKIGLLYGTFTGLLLAAPALGSYCYLPIPFSITALWVLADVLKCIGAGMLIAKIYKE